MLLWSNCYVGLLWWTYGRSSDTALFVVIRVEQSERFGHLTKVHLNWESVSHVKSTLAALSLLS